MPAVELRISPRPEHVRTARLVATAVAKTAGFHESEVEEIRLAVGEACSLAVGLHRDAGLDSPVQIALTPDEAQLLIEVTFGRGTEDSGFPEPSPGEGDRSYDPATLAITLIRSLAGDVEFVEAPHSALVRMRWPIPPPLGKIG